MPGNPEEYRAHARRCWALAAEVTNPVRKKRLTDLAQRWAKVAADLEVTGRSSTSSGAPRRRKGIPVSVAKPHNLRGSM